MTEFDDACAAFRHPTCPSSFAYVLSAFALYPNVADEYIIELPESLKEKATMIAEAKKYEMSVDGKCPLLEDYCLEDDEWHLEHPDGMDCWEKTCKRCVREAEKATAARELSDRRKEAGKRLLHSWALRDGYIAPGVEFWETTPLHPWDPWAPDEVDPSWSWENTRWRIMNTMKSKLGRERGRKLYELCFWAIRVFRPNYSKKEIKAWEELLEGEHVGQDYNLEDWKHTYSDRVYEMLDPGWGMRNESNISKYRKSLRPDLY